MYKNVLLFIICLLFIQDIFAQDWNEIYYLEGEAQYLIEERKYDKAIDIYQRMVREIPDNSYAKYKIGVLYLKTDDQKEKAVEYLEEASQDIALDFDEKSLREIRTPVDVLLYLGEAYQIQNRIDEAIVVYNNLKDLVKPESELFTTANHRIETCENAKTALQNPLRVNKQNLGDPINDDEPNVSAVFSGDGNTVIFTSYTKNYIDNYYSVKENGVWDTPKRISEKLSNKYYLKTSSLSYDGSQLYLVTDDPEENDIFVCFREGRNWTEADKLDKTINGRKSNETHACISKDGNTLYFTSDRDGGFGGMDIYKSTLNEKGKWNDPENLGPAVNTPFDEATPFLTLDDKYLFFSSQGHNSIGGFDVFYIDLDSKSMALNLGYPANTTGDDLFFVPDNSLTSGYTSMYDSTSIGKRDIYYVSILPKIYLAGKITNPKGNQITESDLQVSLIESGSENNPEELSAIDGQFKVEINPGKYTVSITGENFESFTDQIEIPEDYSQSSFIYNATLNPIEVEQEELVSEVVENPVSEPEIEVTESVEEVQEVVKEEKPETFEETKEEQPEPTPEEVVQYVPKTTAVATGKKTYSVQLMALKVPVKVDYFEDVDHVILTQYPDGFYRYTVGNTESYQEALALKEEIHKKGYTDAFIRINDETKSTYTIQIMALIIPVKPDYFKDLSAVVVTKGADDYFRYTIGDYASYEEAKEELKNIQNIGYTSAFVKKTNN
ncbi:MAG: tetratricopeptide repeat protein [Bacteroidetes bacterium]|nr:tetratricopeptide repeat protein [Bacteroidota bacterium]